MKVPLFCWFHNFKDSRADICQIFRWFFGKSKGYSEINWPLASLLFAKMIAWGINGSFWKKDSLLQQTMTLLQGTKIRFAKPRLHTYLELGPTPMLIQIMSHLVHLISNYFIQRCTIPLKWIVRFLNKYTVLWAHCAYRCGHTHACVSSVSQFFHTVDL